MTAQVCFNLAVWVIIIITLSLASEETVRSNTVIMRLITIYLQQKHYFDDHGIVILVTLSL